MKLVSITALLLSVLLIGACNKSDENDDRLSGGLLFNELQDTSIDTCGTGFLLQKLENSFQSTPIVDGWTIPSGEVKDGGPGKDGIPSLQNPERVDASQVDYTDDELVVGFKACSKMVAYPHTILDWHEIANDQVNGIDIALIYCPLTGTANAWNRTIDGQVTTFGVSGLLYNNNIVPYDRETDSEWSQINLSGVHGVNTNRNVELYKVVETTWGTWKKMYPNTKVLSENTGFSRSYGVYPYGSYKTSNHLIFPMSNTDARLHEKERVLGVIDGGNVKVYRFESFVTQGIVQDVYGGKDMVIAGSQPDNYMVSFERKLSDGTILDFTAVQNALPVILQDNEGNKWDIFGVAVEGPRSGQELQHTRSMIGYWFAFPGFFNTVEIYE